MNNMVLIDDIYIRDYNREGEIIYFSLIDDNPVNNFYLRLAINIKDATTIVNDLYQLSIGMESVFNENRIYNLFPIQGKYMYGTIILSHIDRIITIEIVSYNLIKEEYKIFVNPNRSLDSIIEEIYTILFVELL